MKELIEVIAKSLVDHPSEVVVTETGKIWPGYRRKSQKPENGLSILSPKEGGRRFHFPLRQPVA